MSVQWCLKSRSYLFGSTDPWKIVKSFKTKKLADISKKSLEHKFKGTYREFMIMREES